LGLIAAAALTASTAAAFQAKAPAPLVLRARGQVANEVETGKPLPDRSAFGLKRGDFLMLLDARGVRILSGPGVLSAGVFTRTGPAGTDGVRLGGLLASRLMPSSRRRNRIGAVRSAMPWYVDIEQAKLICLPVGHRPIFWRSEATQEGRLPLSLRTGRELKRLGRVTIWPCHGRTV
jgi:hypothetical protein